MQSYQQEGTVRVKIIFTIQHLIWQWYMDNRPGGGAVSRWLFYESNEDEIGWKTDEFYVYIFCGW